jgi:hypothetical protein
MLPIVSRQLQHWRLRDVCFGKHRATLVERKKFTGWLRGRATTCAGCERGCSSRGARARAVCASRCASWPRGCLGAVVFQRRLCGGSPRRNRIPKRRRSPWRRSVRCASAPEMTRTFRRANSFKTTSYGSNVEVGSKPSTIEEARFSRACAVRLSTSRAIPAAIRSSSGLVGHRPSRIALMRSTDVV